MKNEKKKIECGWGRADITPTGKMYLNGQFYRRIGDYEHDPLYATALAIRTAGEKPTVIVSIDLLSIDEYTTECIAKKIAEQVSGFERGQLMCSCIHTHTGPFLKSDYDVRFWGESYRIINFPEDVIKPEEYRDTYLIPRISDCCVKALTSLSASGLSSVLGHAVIGNCRRAVYRDGSSVMYGATNNYNFERLEGCSDNSIEWIYIYNSEGELSGLVVNIACPAQVVENMRFYSADYIGAFRMQLAEKLGRELPVIAIIGAAGDQSPRDLVRRRGNENRGEPCMQDWEGAWELGKRLLCSFEYERERADANIVTEFEYEHEYIKQPLPLRTVTEDETAEAKIKYLQFLERNGSDPYAFSDKDKQDSSWWAGILNRAELQKSCMSYEASIHIIRLGETVIVSTPFELYLEYGLRIRARLNMQHTIIAQLTDDTAGYLPTVFAVKAKSYSAMISNCLVSCEGGEILTETLIQRINEMIE